ncbi:hypothetical protein QQF64_001839 [Cirrhinus molitorella]|uniref:PiggyBac transposable element-derived protein domain-containing protein n=1 Tax=Cirrhinus molitorella TaxID=172907 RepID=A0ABR3MNG8_9TELE
MKEERDTNLQTTSDIVMEEERDGTLHTTRDGGMKLERDTNLQTTINELMEEERDGSLHVTSDGGLKRERNLTLQMTCDEEMVEEALYTMSNEGIKVERDVTLPMTSDGSIKKEGDTSQHMTTDGGVEEERDTSLYMTSDGGMKVERNVTQNMTTDGGKEEESDVTLETMSDRRMEEERDITQHTTSNGGMEEGDTTLPVTRDGGMEEERDGGMEEKTYVTLSTTSTQWIDEEGDLEGEAELEGELFDAASETEDSVEFDPDYHSTDGEESGEELEVTADIDAAYQSKNGNILWTSTTPQQRGRLPAHRTYKTTPGPTRLAFANVKDIKSTFELYFPDHIKQIFIKMTNLEGKRVFRDTWTDHDWTDLQAFIGLLFLAGVYRSRHEAINSLWHSEAGRPIFRATMSLKEFTNLSRVFCFYKRDKRKKDKLAPVRKIWDKWVERLSLLYNPGPNVTVDEWLVRFRGRCPFKQCMRSKPGKYGIKIWVACDSRSSYAWNMQICTGKAADGKSEKKQAMRVVLDMTDGLEGHTVTCDNFFTSYALGEELLRRKMSMIGTVRSNKPELPPALLSMKDRARTSSKFAFTDTHTLVSYCPRKKENMLLMSTFHRNAKVSDKEHKKPEIILDYNHTKGAVDNLDKLIATYTCQRQPSRWPMVIFSKMLDVSAYNAFVLWVEINPSWNNGRKYRRRLFLEELGRALVAPLMQRRENVPQNLAAQNIVKKAEVSCTPVKATLSSPVIPGKRKRCQVCERKKDAKTSLVCSECNKYVCGTHAVTTVRCQECSKKV